MGISYVVKFFRWVILVRGRHQTVTLFHLFAIFAVSYGLSVSLPSKSGDVAGLEVSRRYAKIPYGDGASFVSYYRIFDIALVLLIAGFSSISILELLGYVIFDFLWIYLSSIFILIILFMLFLYPPTSRIMINILLRFVTIMTKEQSKIRNSLISASEGYLATIQAYNNKREMLLTIAGLTGIRWVLEIIAFQWILGSVGIDIGLGIIIMIFSWRVIIPVVTLVPFGIGTSLVTTVVFFGIISVPNPEASAVAVDILSNLIGPILTAIIGLIFTMQLREHQSSSDIDYP